MAEHDGEPVGAAWVRLLEQDAGGYGYVDDETPELAIAIEAPWRGRGVGTLLLQGMLHAAGRAGYEAVSLSVHARNPARRLYERAGFAVVGVDGDSIVMRLELAEPD